MAEAIKEFVNKTFTSSDIINNNEIVLFTNNDTTQAIVKDIIVQNSDIAKTDAKFYIGGIEVMGTFESATGLLFIDKGQSLSVKLNTALTTPSYTKLHLEYLDTTSTASGKYIRYEAAIPNAGLAYPTKASSVPSGLTQIANYSSETPFQSIITDFQSRRGNIFRNSSGNYFYSTLDGNSISTSYLRTSANNQSTIDSGNYTGPALDKIGERLIYHQQSSANVRYADMSGSSVSNTTWSSNFPTGTSSYSQGAYANDLYLYRYSGASPTGGRLSDAPSAYYFSMSNQMNTGNYSNYVMVYNSTEEAYYSFLFNSEAAVENTSGTLIEYITKADIDTALSANGNTVVQTVLLNNGDFSSFLGLGSGGIAATSWHVRPLGGPYLGVPISDTTYKIYLCENQTLTYVKDLTGTYSISTSMPTHGMTMYDGYKAPTSSSLAITDYDIETTIRAVGIEMT